MATDPLSTATRATKRNLLAVSVIAIAYQAFDVRISKIPLAGLEAVFDPRLFAFLLFALLFYFFVTFCTYYYIDIKNIEQTPHQKFAFERYKEWNQLAARIHASRLLTRLQRNAPGLYIIEGEQLAFQKLSIVRHPQYSTDELPQDVEAILHSYRVSRPANPSRPEGADFIAKHEPLLKPFRHIIHDTLVRFRRRRPLDYLLILVQYHSLRGLYFFRNYFLDGLLPIALGIIAFATLFHLFDLHFLARLPL